MKFFKYFLILLVLNLEFISNSFAYPNNRPTDEAVATDIGLCTPGWVTLGTCVAWFRYARSNLKAQIACAATLGSYCIFRNSMEGIARSFRNNSRVANHQDLDSNGLNDFAQEFTQDCTALVGENIPGSGGAGDISREYTVGNVALLPGCRRDPKHGVVGTTYELYNEDLECPGGGSDETGIRVETDWDSDTLGSGQSVCLKQDECDWLDETLVCAYEVDDMLCAEGVYCSMNLLGEAASASLYSVLEGLSNCVDFSAVDGHVADGVDDYSSAGDSRGSGRIRACSEVCEIREGTLTHKDGMGEYSGDCAGENARCTICKEVSQCIDEVNVQRIEGCDPMENGEDRVCGYIYNKKYLAHCVPKKILSYRSDYEIPGAISPYCSGDAVVQDVAGNKVTSFSGKAMRCIDQTLRNLFYGSYVSVVDPDGDGHAEPHPEYFKCIADDRVVSRVSECDAGILIRFREFCEGIVSVLLVLSIFMVGIFTLFGLFQSMKQAVKYLVTFSIVLYFVQGSAWKDGFYDFLVDGGTELGSIAFSAMKFGEISAEDSSVTEDFTLPDNISCKPGGTDLGEGVAIPDSQIGPNNIRYFLDENKYQVWDTYDCRWRAFFGVDDLGGGQNLLDFLGQSIFSVIAFALIFVVVGPITIFLFLVVMLKAMFLSVTALIVISLLVFLSPLAIPLVLFNHQKIKGVFDAWLKNLIGYSLVPVVLFMILAIFFKVLDHAMYGDEVDDVYTVNDDGQTVISEECNAIYIPCLIFKLEDGQYEGGDKSILGIVIDWFSREALMDAMYAILRLFFIFAVMYMVFTAINESIIGSILGVTIMDDKIMQNAVKGVKAGAGIATKGASKAFSALKKAAKKMGSGRNDNQYGTKGKG